jgi:hypothetical protein
VVTSQRGNSKSWMELVWLVNVQSAWTFCKLFSSSVS